MAELGAEVKLYLAASWESLQGQPPSAGCESMNFGGSLSQLKTSSPGNSCVDIYILNEDMVGNTQPIFPSEGNKILTTIIYKILNQIHQFGFPQFLVFLVK